MSKYGTFRCADCCARPVGRRGWRCWWCSSARARAARLTPEAKAKSNESDRRYRLTNEAKAKRKESRRRYMLTPEGKASEARKRHSPGEMERRRRYRSTPGFKARKSERNRKCRELARFIAVVKATSELSRHKKDWK